ncbi:OmpH family outer membrane protein [Sorlinia euscelidii]|uniref:Outer membrane chaperone Skp n=1 Tax=Sorlinia euscelidii TaxID=3081148 RepID=A0ABU7U3C4_9PROT
MAISGRYIALVAMLGASSTASLAAPSTPAAQGGWFVPKASHPANPAPARAPAPAPAPQNQAEAQPSDAPPILPAPPIPDSPDLPKAAPPPPAVIGVISIPTVMQNSVAAQEAQRVLGARRDKLAEAAQKEQASWRAEQQKLQQNARTLSSEQIQIRERHLQERRARAQRDFANRARIIQEAANVALNQIERELVQIVRQVAASHGMNLVYHGEQVALHVEGQDITQETAQQLNKILPHVFIPAADVDPEVLAKSGKMPTTADIEEAGMSPQAKAQAASSAPKSVLRSKK